MGAPFSGINASLVSSYDACSDKYPARCGLASGLVKSSPPGPNDHRPACETQSYGFAVVGFPDGDILLELSDLTARPVGLAAPDSSAAGRHNGHKNLPKPNGPRIWP